MDGPTTAVQLSEFMAGSSDQTALALTLIVIIAIIMAAIIFGSPLINRR